MPETELSGVNDLLNDIYKVYGHDFTQYSRASLNRRIQRFLKQQHMSRIAELQYKVLRDPALFENFINEITVNVTEMFRDASFYKALREKILPELSELPFIKIWHAGCSTGEEMYSMAILLSEAGILQKSIIYGTDISNSVLEAGRQGICPIQNMKQYSENYLAAGGSEELSGYYSARYGLVKFDEKLTSRMVFSFHNLAMDQSFNAFHLIMCRNVFIYFEQDLQSRVISLFNASLADPGFLALGSKESLAFAKDRHAFIEVDKNQKIWRKKQ